MGKERGGCSKKIEVSKDTKKAAGNVPYIIPGLTKKSGIVTFGEITERVNWLPYPHSNLKPFDKKCNCQKKKI